MSLLHTLFAFLAFKNDVGFWKGRSDLSGLSRRAVIGHAICSLIILLYLYDAPGTSWLVLGTVFVSTVIDIWKVSKVLRIAHSDAEAETDAHDSQGTASLPPLARLLLRSLPISVQACTTCRSCCILWWRCGRSTRSTSMRIAPGGRGSSPPPPMACALYLHLLSLSSHSPLTLFSDMLLAF